MSGDHAAFDRQLLALLAQNDTGGAATLALKRYGSEIFSLLAALHRNEAEANDAFSLFLEHLWKGLPGFAGRSSFRTWAYTVARNASHRLHEQRPREVLVTDSAVLELAVAVRTTTWTQLRREKRSRLRELRETLPPDDQLLLILRVERELDWKDLARVMNEGRVLAEPDLARESARLRKRFQAIKDRLRLLAESAGD